MTHVDWNIFFDRWAIKTVSANDRNKNAYVPDAGQRDVIESAGYHPAADDSEEQLLSLTVLLDPEVPHVMASYYLSKRSAQAKRVPEARMGRQLISEWLQQGDSLLLGSIGSTIYALKTGTLSCDPAGAEKVAAALPADVIHARALLASGPAPRRQATRMEFRRDPYVVAAALIRAQGRCEVPACTRALFLGTSGKPFLEVHHLVPLAMNGPDSLANVAALCPSCHREIHHGIEGALLTAGVLSHIAAMPGAGVLP